MIIARSPLRVSFAGGGTDIPAFYRKHGPGCVVSTSIQKHVYVTLNRKFGHGVSVRYKIHELCDRVEDLKHSLIRETLLSYDIHGGIELVVISDVPASGSGLGASSALTCALVAALEASKGQEVPENRSIIAEIAARIEIDRVGSPIGKQDHYASAVGGLNMLRFDSDEAVMVTPFRSAEFLREIESQSMLFYLKIEHTYFDAERKKRIPDFRFVPKILKEQNETMDEKRKIHGLQRDNAVRLWENMAYEVPERFMDHVNENWRLKRTVHRDISNQTIDETIQRAYAAGATAAKVCGAGGGGFLYLMVPPSMQPEVRKELRDLPELEVHFDTNGVEVIYNDEARSRHAVAA